MNTDSARTVMVKCKKCRATGERTRQRCVPPEFETGHTTYVAEQFKCSRCGGTGAIQAELAEFAETTKERIMSKDVLDRYAAALRRIGLVRGECVSWENVRKLLDRAWSQSGIEVDDAVLKFERAALDGADTESVWQAVMLVEQARTGHAERLAQHMVHWPDLAGRLRAAYDEAAAARAELDRLRKEHQERQLDAFRGKPQRVSFGGMSGFFNELGFQVHSSDADEKVVKVHVHAEPDPSIAPTLSTS